jgi:D-alanyl-D-alanine carboxypeptidase
VPVDLSKLLEDSLTELGAPGVLCAVSCGGEVSTHSAGTISASEHARPFYIYSITKVFTATAVMILCERGGFVLDQSMTGLLPDAGIPDAITVRQLLNHTGGLSDYFSSAAYREAVHAHPEEPWPFEELMRVGLAGTPRFEPGCGWSYSNPGYAFLNQLIEKLSGLSWHAYVGRFIAQPLGLVNTRPFLEPDCEGKLLPGVEPAMTGDFRVRYSPGWIAPGCLISTAADAVRFFDALFSGRLLRDESLEQMKQTVDVPVPPMNGAIPAYGLGLMHTRNDPLGDSYGHGGGGPGYTTYARWHPSIRGAEFSLCLVVNTSLPATPFGLADRITRAFIDAR